MTTPGGLELRSIDFRYRRGRPALAGVSWAPGRRAALLGPNGAGKSTLFGVACGALRPERGGVEVAGAAAAPGQVAWMPQTIQALPTLRCREQVALAGWMQGLSRARAWDAAADALEIVNLAQRAGDRAATLSGGQLRRLGLAEALVGDPAVVLLDEPTVGLDPMQRDQVRGLLIELGERCQLIVATHLVEDLAQAFDTVTVLVEGSIRFDGSVDAFLALAPDGGTFTGRATAAYAAVAAAT